MPLPSVTNEVTVRNVAFRSIGSCDTRPIDGAMDTVPGAPCDKVHVIIGDHLIGHKGANDMEVFYIGYQYNLLNTQCLRQIMAGQQITVYRDGVTYNMTTSEATHFYISTMVANIFLEAVPCPDADDILMGDERDYYLRRVLGPIKKRS